MRSLNSDDMITITKIFAKSLIFAVPTATHSAGVAYTAEKLAELIGFQRRTQNDAYSRICA